MNPLANFSLTTARTNQSLDPSEETPSPRSQAEVSSSSLSSKRECLAKLAQDSMILEFDPPMVL